jgi:FkbM family methyltransferase
MKIFMDVGGNEGQTLKEVFKEKYGFDKIFCFEPSIVFYETLKEFSKKDNRIHICNFGLGDKNSKKKLYASGTLRGSIYKQNSEDDKINSEIIEIVNTSEWYSNNINKDDLVFIKLNCEGSEIDILNNLIDSGLIRDIYNILITFDIREFKEYQDEEIKLRKRLKANNLINFCFADNVMIGNTHEKRIENWLKIFGADKINESKENLKRIHKSQFLTYSKKRGLFNIYEVRLKRLIGYDSYPQILKSFFKFIKNSLGLTREKK